MNLGANVAASLGLKGFGGANVPRYPADALYEEMAYIAYHFHWSLSEIGELEHGQRHKWVEEISKINRRLTGGED